MDYELLLLYVILAASVGVAVFTLLLVVSLRVP